MQIVQIEYFFINQKEMLYIDIWCLFICNNKPKQCRLMYLQHAQETLDVSFVIA